MMSLTKIDIKISENGISKNSKILNKKNLKINIMIIYLKYKAMFPLLNGLLNIFITKLKVKL
jgi:hypothetical protein